MAGRRPSPHADDPSCGGGGANSSITPQEPEVYSPDASHPRAHHSGQPGRSIFVNEDSSGGPTIGAASSSAWGPVEDQDAKITDKTAAPFLLGPRRLSSPTGGSDSDSDDDDCDTWGSFSDRTCGGASTSLSSPDAYDYRTFFGDPAFFEETHDEEPLSSLEAELVYKAMKDKANMLLANYSEYRKVSGDGSCLYRSFIYSYLEQLVNVSPDEELRLVRTLEPLLEKFQRLHLPGSYYDGHNWCRWKVIPMWAEGDEVHLVALTDVLHVPLQIVIVDISATEEPNTHIIYESPDDLPLVPCVTLLYRPGHYDIIYK
ncbi:hypothetical protein ACQ4PT_041981 [Festuca glaucescens]